MVIIIIRLDILNKYMIRNPVEFKEKEIEIDTGYEVCLTNYDDCHHHHHHSLL